MWHALMTILVFIGWGLTWGAVLGALSGTLIFPGVGTLYAVIWGTGMGGVMGAVTGGLAVLSDRLFRHEKMNLQRYRRRLSVVFGTITSVGVAMMLIATTRGFLWGGTGYYTDMRIFLLLSLIAGVVWGWLGAAYTAVRHVDSNLSDAMPAERIDSASVIPRLMWAAANRWTVILGAAAGLIAHLSNLNGYLPASSLTGAMQLRIAFEGMSLGFFAALGDIFLLGLANGFLLLFANRLYFKEYAPHLTLAQYKTRISVLVFLFTLFAGLLVSGFVFVPLSAIIAVMAARSYADWLYDGTEKRKRKAKEDYSHLETSDTASEVYVVEDDAAEEMAQKG